MEMARSMLYEKKLPKMFWAEAVATSVYLLNRLATKAVSGKSPIEAWSGIKLSIQHLKDLTDSKIVISRDVIFDEGAYWDWIVDEVKRHEDTFSNETHHDEFDIPEFDIEDTTDTDVLRIRQLVDVYESCNSVIEPESYMDASKHSEWIDAMKAELEMIKKNNTWKLVDLPKGKNAIGVDFGDTFAPIARHDTIKLLIAIAAQRNWKIHHFDVKSAFLNGELEEEIYVKQPEGFEVISQEEKFYRLYKALYGLKQAPRAWYAKIDAHLLNHNFRRSSSESTLYIKQFNSQERLIISLYVDDLLVIGSNDHLVKKFKKQMESEFNMSDMGLVSYFLGMEIKQLPNGVHISQRKYASDMLKKFKMFLCKLVTSPLVYKSSFLSRFMGEPSSSHLGAAKRVLRYVKVSLDLGIVFERNKVVKLEGYADSDWAGSIDDSKSTSGYIFTLASGVFYWNSKSKALSHNLLHNKSAIAFKNSRATWKTKAYQCQYHAILRSEKNREVKLKYCTSETQLADMLKKSITGKKLNYFKAQLMKSNNNLKEDGTTKRNDDMALKVSTFADMEGVETYMLMKWWKSAMEMMIGANDFMFDNGYGMDDALYIVKRTMESNAVRILNT
ncbi:retrovirus-related pol polyprotein from transposon TNT 1-94 [Tanacetum coccineum]